MLYFHAQTPDFGIGILEGPGKGHFDTFCDHWIYFVVICFILRQLHM
jgi:hypothetical protein